MPLPGGVTPRRHHVAIAAAVAVAAGVAGVALSLGTDPDTRTQQAQPAPSQPARPSPGCQDASKNASTTLLSSLGTGRLLFVGASYSIGVGATSKADRFPNLLASRLHLPFQLDAVGGTGFQNAGPHHQGTFAERIARDPDRPAPRLVIIQGGRDDANYPVPREYTDARNTIMLAQQRFPRAQVVVLGPLPAMLPVNPRVVQMRNAIAEAADDTHAGFIDPIAERWITKANEHRFAGPVKGHPNDAGYAYITNRLLNELPAALKAARPPLHPAPSAAQAAPSTPPAACGTTD